MISAASLIIILCINQVSPSTASTFFLKRRYEENLSPDNLAPNNNLVLPYIHTIAHASPIDSSLIRWAKAHIHVRFPLSIIFIPASY